MRSVEVVAGAEVVVAVLLLAAPVEADETAGTDIVVERAGELRDEGEGEKKSERRCRPVESRGRRKRKGESCAEEGLVL